MWFQTRCKEITRYVFEAVKSKLPPKIGYFELYGLDYMVDENMNVSITLTSWIKKIHVFEGYVISKNYSFVIQKKHDH